MLRIRKDEKASTALSAIDSGFVYGRVLYGAVPARVSERDPADSPRVSRAQQSNSARRRLARAARGAHARRRRQFVEKMRGRRGLRYGDAAGQRGPAAGAVVVGPAIHVRVV